VLVLPLNCRGEVFALLWVSMANSRKIGKPEYRGSEKGPIWVLLSVFEWVLLRWTSCIVDQFGCFKFNTLCGRLKIGLDRVFRFSALAEPDPG
jgi:hypothetical protein